MFCYFPTDLIIDDQRYCRCVFCDYHRERVLWHQADEEKWSLKSKRLIPCSCVGSNCPYCSEVGQCLCFCVTSDPLSGGHCLRTTGVCPSVKHITTHSAHAQLTLTHSRQTLSYDVPACSINQQKNKQENQQRLW